MAATLATMMCLSSFSMMNVWADKKEDSEPLVINYISSRGETDAALKTLKKLAEDYKKDHPDFEFNVESTGKKTVMKPMQKMVYNPTNAQTEIRNIIHVNWKDGKFHFKDVPLQQLIKTINQIYDTNIVLDKMINHESAFTGIIRYDEPLEDVISKICFSLNLTQEKQKNHIMIKNE